MVRIMGQESREAGGGNTKSVKARKRAKQLAQHHCVCTSPSAAGEEDGDDTGPDSGGSVQVQEVHEVETLDGQIPQQEGGHCQEGQAVGLRHYTLRYRGQFHG